MRVALPIVSSLGSLSHIIFTESTKSDINMVSLLLSNSKSTILHDETILSSFLEKLQEYTNNNIPVITKYVTFFLI